MFREGDWVIFTDNRVCMVERLTSHRRLHTHWGYIEHDDVLGREPGSIVETSRGKKLYVFAPTLADYVMHMPRKSGIIYPKDTGIILLWADVFPGSRVLVGGVGSGGLLLAVLRQVGEKGRVVAYDVRQDMLDRAAENVKGYFGDLPPYLELRLGDIYAPEDLEEDFDRVLLDVPEPWRALETVCRVLLPGGILCSYLPSILQVARFENLLRRTESFALIETLEVMMRGWHIEGRAIRPQHRMVGHTGFLTFARLSKGGAD
ncbi:tRNA (adenine-N1)-methyltransferase [Thermanaeromonas sp. C210]|uniref:tRNA (adenine-N1)-methyltransferase n=1 Tax=Thermanaeromonas sp. C210 TaxID=2731925 RepID=UPI00155D0419|nr:methyltransferase domain-containing protein [Thermanaeromonas sp. C210]GFN22894.1 tRNA (adenine-N1)-methyltransferase [Thermanaeromonas sp. C210]